MKTKRLSSLAKYPDLTKIRLLVGIHSDDTPPLGPLIMLVTNHVMGPPYVLGGVHPATHAFVCLEYAGVRWRLDAHPPESAWSPWWDYEDESLVALWEVIGSEEGIRRGIDKADRSGGVVYDLGLLIAQLLTLVPPGVLPPQVADLSRRFPVIPKILKLPDLPDFMDPLKLPTAPTIHLPALPDLDICTTLTMDVVKEVGEPLTGDVVGMPDRFPERLGQCFVLAESDGHLVHLAKVNML